MTIEDWTRIADRFVRVLETGDVADLERLYHPDLRFTVRTAGTAFDRDEALANFRQMWTLLPCLCGTRRLLYCRRSHW
jgi:hypothetical protein